MFVMVMISILAVIVGTFFIPITLAWLIFLYVFGLWLIVIGFISKEPHGYAIMANPSFRVGWGSLFITMATTILVSALLQDIRMTLLAFVLLFMLSVVLAYLAGAK
jgi:hypothetical protein